MKLSEAYDKHRTVPREFAVCVGCHGAWEDDMEGPTSLNCPRCTPPVCLLRGVEDPKQFGCKLDVDSLAELAVAVDVDPGTQVKNIHPDSIIPRED